MSKIATTAASATHTAATTGAFSPSTSTPRYVPTPSAITPVRLYERQVGIYTTIIDAGTASGTFAPVLPMRVIARNLVALEDGYGLHMTMAAPTMPVDEARRQLISFAADATRCSLEGTS